MHGSAFELDEPLLTRVFLGVLSEHEQRMMMARLFELDSELRLELAKILDPFEMFDLDLVTDFEIALEQGQEAAPVRSRLLERSRLRVSDFADLMGALTFGDLNLGEVARRLFTWTMAEVLLERAADPELDLASAGTSLHLAQMVIDIVELLGAAGHSPRFPHVVGDVRRRIRRVGRRHRENR